MDFARGSCLRPELPSQVAFSSSITSNLIGADVETIRLNLYISDDHHYSSTLRAILTYTLTEYVYPELPQNLTPIPELRVVLMPSVIVSKPKVT